MRILLDDLISASVEKVQITEESTLGKDEHGHEFIELVYFCSAGGYHYVNGKTFPIKRGDVFLIAPYVPHYYTRDLKRKNGEGEAEDYKIEVINLIFHKSVLGDAFSDKNFNKHLIEYYVDGLYKSVFMENSDDCIHAYDDDLKIYNFLIDIREEQKAKNLGYIAIVEAKLKEILILTIRKYITPDKQEEEFSSKGIAIFIASWIEQNYREPVNLEEIADRCFLSVSSIRRIFKQYFGIPIFQYMQQVKIKMACKYLLEENLTVDALMEKIGLNDRKWFYELFRRETGITPKEYRLKNLEEEKNND